MHASIGFFKSLRLYFQKENETPIGLSPEKSQVLSRLNDSKTILPAAGEIFAKVSPNRLGIAMGGTGAIFYAMCWALMAVIPMGIVVWSFNGLMHGADMTTIMRESVPLTQSFVGILSTFFGGWILGGLTAWFYNLIPGHNSLTSNP